MELVKKISLGLATFSFASAFGVTPHEQYSSSIGVLGCFTDTNRIAYFPGFPTCNDFCKQITYDGRTVFVAHVDQSGGAYDISYNAYNYLLTGQSATANPTQGGATEMDVQTVDPSMCAGIFPNGKMVFSAPSGSFFPILCPAGSWVHENFELRNIATLTCTYGINEVCGVTDYDQPTCPHQVGLQTPLTGLPTYNIEYGTGRRYVAP